MSGNESMIQRVAEAIAEAEGFPYGARNYLETARAAIEAMQPSFQAARSYADECEAKIAFLIDQIDKMLQASQASSQSKPD